MIGAVKGRRMSLLGGGVAFLGKGRLDSLDSVEAVTDSLVELELRSGSKMATNFCGFNSAAGVFSASFSGPNDSIHCAVAAATLADFFVVIELIALATTAAEAVVEAGWATGFALLFCLDVLPFFLSLFRAFGSLFFSVVPINLSSTVSVIRGNGAFSNLRSRSRRALARRLRNHHRPAPKMAIGTSHHGPNSALAAGFRSFEAGADDVTDLERSTAVDGSGVVNDSWVAWSVCKNVI